MAGTGYPLVAVLPTYLPNARVARQSPGRTGGLRPFIAAVVSSQTRAFVTGVCENDDHGHKEPSIAICVPTRKMQYEMHLAI